MRCILGKDKVEYAKVYAGGICALFDSKPDMKRSHPLEGHTALITSSSRNLGAEVARRLAEEGASVIVTYFSSMELAKELVDGLAGTPGKHVAVFGDTSTAAGTREMVKQACRAASGTIDILVNNSGPFSMTPYAELPGEEWERIWDGNVTAAFISAQILTPVMRSNAWGRIVNVSAGSAYLRNHSIYTLAKEAIITLTESLAVELAPEITVNCVAPGQISESADEIADFDPTFVKRAISRTPLGRLVTRTEVAGVITGLCGKDFDAVTGVTIPVDGGWRINRF